MEFFERVFDFLDDQIVLRNDFGRIVGRFAGQISLNNDFFPVLLTSPFILHHLAYGQSNILILAVTVFALSLIKKQRDATGGVFLGLAIVLKVIAAPFVIWFIGGKSWRVILGVIIGGVVGAIVIPSLILGVELNFFTLIFGLET